MSQEITIDSYTAGDSGPDLELNWGEGATDISTFIEIVLTIEQTGGRREQRKLSLAQIVVVDGPAGDFDVVWAADGSSFVKGVRQPASVEFTPADGKNFSSDRFFFKVDEDLNP